MQRKLYFSPLTISTPEGQVIKNKDWSLCAHGIKVEYHANAEYENPLNILKK